MKIYIEIFGELLLVEVFEEQTMLRLISDGWFIVQIPNGYVFVSSIAAIQFLEFKLFFTAGV